MWQLNQPTTPAELEAYYDLRWRVLREPWGQPRGSERDEFESIAKHLAAYDEGGKLIGVGRLHLNEPAEAQIRYMAVEEVSRGKGIGRLLVEQLEQVAGTLGSKIITLNSRDTAVGFYEQLGYRVTGVGPTLFGSIIHLNMAKNLDDSTEQ